MCHFLYIYLELLMMMMMMLDFVIFDDILVITIIIIMSYIYICQVTSSNDDNTTHPHGVLASTITNVNHPYLNHQVRLYFYNITNFTLLSHMISTTLHYQSSSLSSPPLSLSFHKIIFIKKSHHRYHCNLIKSSP